MGLQNSHLKGLLSGQPATEWCYPSTPYVPFAKHKWPAGAHGLVTDIHLLPDHLFNNSFHDNAWFWWSDAQFVPFKDTCLYATTSAYLPRLMQHWVSVSHVANGKVFLYNLSSADQMECKIFGRTGCTVFPNVNPHPLGEIVAYCGVGEVVVMSAEGDPVYQRTRDIGNAVHLSCSIAKNGVSFASLKRGIGAFFLESFTLGSSLFCEDCIRCHTVCPGFIPSRNIPPDVVNCKFSPDSKFLAVSSNRGFLFVVKKSKLEKFAVVCPDMTGLSLSSSQTFDYHPVFPSQIMTIGASNKNILTLNIATSEVLISTETEEYIDCLTYSHDGLFLSVGFHNFDINLYGSENLNLVHKIPVSSICVDSSQHVQINVPVILHLSFSQNGEHLVSTSCDGRLRLWRIPRLYSLQELCRDKILSCMPIRNVDNLVDIPKRIRNFLCYKYF